MTAQRLKYDSLSYLDSIRLLRLAPSQDRSAPLKGSLLEVTLSDCYNDLKNPFTALSYVWGDPKHRGSIDLDGCLMGITQSLDRALHDLRDETQVLRVWADALCINQLDIPERNNQVALMGNIYSTANHTVIYLGTSTPEFEKLCRVLSPSLYDPALSRSHLVDEAKASLATNEIEALRRDLLGRPWFRRVWVFQELVLSADPWVQCGRQRTRWHQFSEIIGADSIDKAMLLYAAPAVYDKKPSELPSRPSTVAVGKRHGTFDVPLSSLLSLRRGVGATDPRDTIYGHLGVASDSNIWSQHIKIDYNKTVTEVMVDAARYFLSVTNLGKLLDHAITPPPLSTTPTIPSFIPRWAAIQPTQELLFRKRPGNDAPYVEFEGRHGILLPGHPVLCVSGFYNTRIDGISPVFPEHIAGLDIEGARKTLETVGSQ